MDARAPGLAVARRGRRPQLRHERLAAWVEHMKGVYNSAIAEHAASGQMNGSDIHKVRNHLECLAMIQTLLREHKAMADGVERDFGDSGLRFHTEASLIKPNGEVIHLKRSGK